MVTTPIPNAPDAAPPRPRPAECSLHGGPSSHASAAAFLSVIPEGNLLLGQPPQRISAFRSVIPEGNLLFSQPPPRRSALLSVIPEGNLLFSQPPPRRSALLSVIPEGNLLLGHPRPRCPAKHPLSPKPWALSPRSSGFTLIELMIVMMIIGLLLAMAVPAYVANVRSAREAVLREDLHALRTAIDSYTVDKQKAPQSLDDLVQSGYLKVMPVDPMTRRNDTWMTVQSDALSSIDQTDPGITDVHSGAQQTAADGTTYNTW